MTHLIYIELARTLSYYSSIPAGDAVTDAVNVGEPNSATIRVRVSLASKELTLASVTNPSHEQRYKVTRMRCWRITTLHNYIELARTLSYYSSIPAGDAVTDAVNVGEPNSATIRVRVSLASKELTLASVTNPSHEQRYKVTRMRCWRITTLHN
ncbi:jg7388, partial [Pararge aegeria aegeria]